MTCRYVFDPFVEQIYLWKVKNKAFPCTIDFGYGKAIVKNLISGEVDLFCAYSKTVDNALGRYLGKKITPRWSKQFYSHSHYVFKLESEQYKKVKDSL